MISAASRRKGTLFTISVPQVTPERLALAFKFLRGFSDGALLQAKYPSGDGHLFGVRLT